MYLLLNEDEKIIVENVSDIPDIDMNKYKIYSLVLVDTQDLINDGNIRDEIKEVLKGKEMIKEKLIQSVSERLEIPKSKVSKVVNKMRKEKVIFDIEGGDGLGNILVSMID